ncbi:MAG: hypothetical protein CMM01_21975 [Rhodopirellula sp.]|nr:hypothetical protein [Rhodopirellula sp.]
MCETKKSFWRSVGNESSVDGYGLLFIASPTGQEFRRVPKFCNHRNTPKSASKVLMVSDHSYQSKQCFTDDHGSIRCFTFANITDAPCISTWQRYF